MSKKQKAYLFFKRIVGILGSIVGILVCFSLLWWWVFIINLIVTKGHPIYVQERYGKHKKVFKLLKFRSMKVDVKEVASVDVTDDMREEWETGFGKFLRKTSIDETLQLFNILIGQMAFVGPRPGAAHNEEDLVQRRESYTPSAFEVKPGLTGYAQVMMSRQHIPEGKAKYDSEYVKNLSFLLDVKIFFLTIFNIFGKGRGN